MTEKLRILVVDDDRRLSRTLVDILTIKGHQAEAAYSGPEALDMVKQEQFDCVLSDIRMPEMSGVELHRAIKEAQPQVPVVLMTAYSSDRLVQEGLEQGALAILTKPLDINNLLCFLSSLRRQQSVVIVDDDPVFCQTLGDILEARGFAVSKLTDPSGVAESLDSDELAVLLDMKLNSIGGLEVLKEIRGRCPRLPVILVTGYRQEMSASIQAAMEIGAYACLYKPFDIDKLLQALAELRQRDLSRILGRPMGKDRPARALFVIAGRASAVAIPTPEIAAPSARNDSRADAGGVLRQKKVLPRG